MFVLVFVTCPDAETAMKIGEQVVGERLAACVSAVPGVKSVFWWRGELDKASEVLMLLKTRAALLERLVERVGELHPYEVPEVVAVPIVGGHEDYLSWVREETRSG